MPVSVLHRVRYDKPREKPFEPSCRVRGWLPYYLILFLSIGYLFKHCTNGEGEGLSLTHTHISLTILVTRLIFHFITFILYLFLSYN